MTVFQEEPKGWKKNWTAFVLSVIPLLKEFRWEKRNLLKMASAYFWISFKISKDLMKLKIRCTDVIVRGFKLKLNSFWGPQTMISMGLSENLEVWLAGRGGGHFKRRSEKHCKRHEWLFWPANLSQIKIYFFSEHGFWAIILSFYLRESLAKVFSKSPRDMAIAGWEGSRGGKCSEDIFGSSSSLGQPALMVRKSHSPILNK